MPNNSEISTMKTFEKVLESIVKITETLGGEKLVTISAVRPLLYKLLSIRLIENVSDSSIAKEMKKILMADLKEHSDEGLLNWACFLDPRFKALAFMAESDESCVAISIKE